MQYTNITYTGTGCPYNRSLFDHQIKPRVLERPGRTISLSCTTEIFSRLCLYGSCLFILPFRGLFFSPLSCFQISLTTVCHIWVLTVHVPLDKEKSTCLQSYMSAMFILLTCCRGSTSGIVPQFVAKDFSAHKEAINIPDIFGDHHLQQISFTF